MGKRKLDLGDTSAQDNELTVNEDFKKRFEHNKKREELHRLQEKYGNDLESEDSEEDEIEDDSGDLATTAINTGINDVLRALKSDPTGEKLKENKDLKFFPEIGAEGTREAEEREVEDKPMRLKDYHRENLLAQSRNGSDTAGNLRPESYNDQQVRQKQELLNEINQQFDANSDDESDGDLLSKRSEERDLGDVPLELPDADANPDEFLNTFLSGNGWIDRQSSSKDGKNIPSYSQVVEEDSDSFDDLTEQFESAYNFRFEDPNAAEIVSYARDQSTIRRSAESSRQKKREKRRLEREQEEQKRKLELAKLRKHKIGEVYGKLERLQKVLGDEDVAAKFTEEDLEGEWNNDEWDKRMQKLFDDDYYNQEDKHWKPEPDADINESAGEYDDAVEETKQNKAASNTEGGEGESLKNLSKKELKRKASEFVDTNTDLLLDETYVPKSTFRYSEVEPESYGLTARDILLASDKQLNEYVGLKKLASYRDKAKQQKDRQRYSKKKRLRDWRKETFGTDDGPSEDLWNKLKQETSSQPESTAKRQKHKQKKHKKH